MCFRALLAAAALLILARCDDVDRLVQPRTDPPAVAAPSAIVVNPTELALPPGGQWHLTVAVKAADGHLLDLPVTWSSSDPAVVRVSEEGVVEGLQIGVAIVTARVGELSRELSVSVRSGESGPTIHGLVWTEELVAEGLAPLNGIWGSSASDVYAVGSSRLWDCCAVIAHYDGHRWRQKEFPELAGELHSIWGSSATDVFAVGAEILHWNGHAWSTMGQPGSFSAATDVWGTSGNDVFVVRADGGILHYDGVIWESMTVPHWSDYLNGIWGSSHNDVFAVGGYSADPEALILHYDGMNWTRMEVPVAKPLHAVWGTSARNVYAVGNEGTILHYDGATWTKVQSPTTQELIAIWGTSPTEIFVTGSKNWYPNCCAIMLHYDGARWRGAESPTGMPLAGIWGSSAKDIFIVGFGPTILHGTQ